MNPPEQIVFQVLDRKTGEKQGAYSRSYWTEYDFKSPESARSSNCHGIYQNKEKFKIAKYRVTYELIEDDVS